MTVNCPKCQQNDHIQKLNSIYSSGTVKGNYSGSAYAAGRNVPVSLDASFQTNLASRLRPPQKPSIPGILWYIMPILPLGYLIMLLAPIGRSGRIKMLMMIGCVLAFASIVAHGELNTLSAFLHSLSNKNSSIATNSEFRKLLNLSAAKAGVGDYLLLLFLVAKAAPHNIQLIMGHILMMMLSILLYFGFYYAGLVAAKRKVEREQYPIWQASMSIWNNSYYCHRDDIIFEP
jgi:hypothetical protein